MRYGKNGKVELSTLFFKAAALLSAVIIIFFTGFIFFRAYPVVSKMGISYFTTTIWNVEGHHYGIFNYIVGTIVLTAMTMIIACPVSILTAIYLAEYAPRWLEYVLRTMIELLVGIPSVVYGIFGYYIIRLLMRDDINPLISNNLGFIPIFSNNSPQGLGLLLASTVLAIMVLPVITVLAEDALRSIPPEYKEASLSLGSTKWEFIKKVAVPASATGITTAILLGLMRAMGETMAILMLTGNTALVPTTIFQQIYAMTSQIVTGMSTWGGYDEPQSALFGIAATLFLMEISVITISRLIIRRSKKT